MRQPRIRIPAPKGISGTGRHCVCHSIISTIELCSSWDIASAIGIIGYLKIFASIINVQFLFRLSVLAGRGDRCTFCPFQISIWICLNDRSYITVQDAFYIGCSFNLSIAVARQILQQIDKIIYRSVRNILKSDSAFLFVVKIICIHRKCRCFRIIGCSTHPDFSLGTIRRFDRIWQVFSFNLDQIDIEFFIWLVFYLIIIFCSDRIFFNITENSNCIKVSVNNCFSRNLLFRI